MDAVSARLANHSDLMHRYGSDQRHSVCDQSDCPEFRRHQPAIGELNTGYACIGSTDTYALYNASMGTEPNGYGVAQISRSGTAGTYGQFRRYTLNWAARNPARNTTG